MEEPPSYHSIQVVNESDLSFDVAAIEDAVALCLEIGRVHPSSVRVLVTSDERVAELNQRFRGIPEQTDVLSFPDEDAASGDIAIAGPYATRQAGLRGITPQEEVTLLALHGTLHLLGLDDDTEADRRHMIRQMYQVAGQLGMRTDEDWGSLLHQETAS